METKRFIGNDMTRIFARVRRELGPDAVIVQTRSLLRDGADPLIEVLAAPGGGEQSLPLELQRLMTEGALARVETSGPAPLTVGDLEDLAARDDAYARAFDELDRTAGDVEPSTPEWLEGFVPAAPAPARFDVEEFDDALHSEDTIGPFDAPVVPPPPPVQWSPRPRIVTRSAPAEPAPLPRPAEPAAAMPRALERPERGVAGELVTAGLSRNAAHLVARHAAAGATAEDALREYLASAHLAYPSDGRTAIVTIQGAEGSGRTTALMRMALDCADSGREAVLVAADSAHAGGRAQLHAYGEALGLPVFDAFGPQDVIRAVTRAPKGACVFVDVPAGRWSPPPMPGVEHFVYLAVPAHWSAGATAVALAEFDPATCAGVVITGGDLATELTPAISLAVESQLGIAFLSSGRDIATGITVADPFTLASGVFTTSTRETTDGRLAVTA